MNESLVWKETPYNIDLVEVHPTETFHRRIAGYIGVNHRTVNGHKIIDYNAGVPSEYDPETDSDCLFLGTCKTINEAKLLVEAHVPDSRYWL